MPSASAALALYDSPAPPSTQLIAPFSTRAMTKLAGYGALGPLAVTCIRSAALVAGAVSTALVAGEKPGARPSTSAMLHSDASSSSCVALAAIPGSQHLNSGERGLLADLCLEAGEVVDVGLSPLDQVLLGSASYSISNAVQEQVVAGEMLLAPLAPVRFWSCSSSAALLTNIAISEQVLAEEMLPGAVASPLGLQSASSSSSLLTAFITDDILGRAHCLPSVQPGLLAVVAGDQKLLPGLEPLVSTIRGGGWGMGFAGAPPSGQHLLLGVPHRRRMSSYPFAARGGGAPRRGYAAATTGGGVEENVNRDKKVEDLERRMRIVEKAQVGMLRRQRNGRVVLIGIMLSGGAVWHSYGDDLMKKGDKAATDFLGDRVKGALLAEVTWSNFSAGINYMSYGVLGSSKERQAIDKKHNEDLKRAKEELAKEWEQKKIDWYRHKREKEDRFYRNRPANEHPLVRYIAWIRFSMHDEELEAKRADWLKYRRLAAIRARAIINQEKKEEEEKKREEEEKKKREEEDAERRKNQSLAEIRARAIRDGEKKEEKKKREEVEKK